MITRVLTESGSVTVIRCNDGWLEGVEICLRCATGEFSAGKWGSEPSSDTEIKDSVASEMGTRGSGRLARGLDCAKLWVEGVLMPIRDETEGDDMEILLGGIGPGGRSGGGDIAERRREDEATEEGLRNDVSKDSRTSSSSSRNVTDGMDGDGCRTDEL